MDVVWPLSNGSRHDDWELRYSMRSFAENVECGNFWIIGHRPSWLDHGGFPSQFGYRKITHIPHPDPFRIQKDANLVAKMLRMALVQDLSETFIFASDDQLVLQPVNHQDFGPWWDRDFVGAWPRQHTVDRMTVWERRVLSTARMLHAAGYPAKHFDTHVPQIVCKKGIGKLLEFDFVTGGKTGTTFFTLYQNANRVEGHKIDSRHVRGSLMSAQIPAETVLWKLENNLFCAYSDAAFGLPDFVPWVEARFPSPGPWEAFIPSAIRLKSVSHYSIR